ncbi:Hsp20/alpha crystallin family protein [Candidatus Bathyarchaeota archaeon]|nr:Hsp20/alpha crystallin family protein [Candidatus Bathyarchaeota archaeon]
MKGEIAPWKPSEFLSEIDRMFNEFRRGFESMLWPVRAGWPRLTFPSFELPDVREPCADLIDAGKEYRVCVEMPGIPKEKVDVTVTPRGIEIAAEAKTQIEEDKEGYIHRERGYTKVYRSLSFPDDVLPDKAEATLNNGVLEVRVPKKTPTEVKKHKISIR